MDHINKTLGKKHMELVAQLPCAVSGRRPVQVHHLTYRRDGERRFIRGMRKLSDFEVIPLHIDYHTGQNGIHRGVKSWEAKHGYQEDLYEQTCEILGVKKTPPK